MRKYILLLLLAFSLLSTNQSVKAQHYKNAIGLRLGYPWAVSFKTFISNKNALEFTGFFRSWKGYRYTGIGVQWLHHEPIKSVAGLKYYLGLGGKIGFYNFDNGFKYNGDGKTSVGINGALGLDYKFKDAPINLSLDWMPTFWLNGYRNGFSGDGVNLAIRLTF